MSQHADNEYFLKQMHLFDTWKLKGQTFNYSAYKNEQEKRRNMSLGKDYRSDLSKTMAKPKPQRKPLNGLDQFGDIEFLKLNTTNLHHA